jgi:hypothetical protein
VIIWLLATSAVVCAGGFLWKGADSGPAYNGKTLSDWLVFGGPRQVQIRSEAIEMFAHQNLDPRIKLKLDRELLDPVSTPAVGLTLVAQNPAAGPVREAIRAVGTNLLPDLLKWIEYEPPFGRLVSTIDNSRTSVRNLGWVQRFRRWLTVSGKLDRATASLNAFYVLGPDACAAIPHLEQLAKYSGSLEVRRRAQICLAVVDVPDWLLRKRLRYGDTNVVKSATAALRRKGLQSEEQPLLHSELGTSL